MAWKEIPGNPNWQFNDDPESTKLQELWANMTSVGGVRTDGINQVFAQVRRAGDPDDANRGEISATYWNAKAGVYGVQSPSYYSSLPTVGGGLWTPADLGTSLVLWLDADDASTITLNSSTVSQWSDKSGNGNHVVQATASAQPLYAISSINSKPVVKWTTGYHGLLTNTQFSFQDFDVFVAYQDTGSETYERLVDHSFLSGFWLGRDGNTANSWRSGVRQGTIPYGIAIPLTDGIWHIIESQRSGTTHNLVGDGGSVSNTQTVVSTATQRKGIGIGAQFDQTVGNLTNGEIGEVLIFSEALAPSDRQKLEGYLAWKWGLEANLPADHPYKSAPPTV